MARKIFFSYARADQEFALKLAQDLRAKDIDLWVDQLDIGPGVRWDSAIEDALKAASTLLLVLSPASVVSDNVLDEVGYALDHGKSIVPVLFQECDVPLRLRRLQRIDFTRDHAAAMARCLGELRRLVADGKVSDPAGLTPGSGGTGLTSGSGVKVLQGVRPGGSDTSHTAQLRADGAIRVVVGSGANDREQWIVPGSGKTTWFKDFEQGPEMVVVPHGGFFMGSLYYGSEKPPHFVGFARPFAVGRFPLLISQWVEIMLECQSFANQNSDGPAAPVTWNDAVRFAERLSSMTGKSYRLLSEAEWEYCADAGTWDDSVAMILSHANDSVESGRPALSKTEPNDWGLRGLYHSFREWCSDDWVANYVDAPRDGSSRRRSRVKKKVTRGGLLFKQGESTRAEERSCADPSNASDNIGFRVARDLE